MNLTNSIRAYMGNHEKSNSVQKKSVVSNGDQSCRKNHSFFSSLQV